MAKAAITERDPFRFGWRLARGTNGRPGAERIPLTPADLLHPQEDDQIPENTMQLRDRGYVYDVLQARLAGRPGFLVLSDCLIDWGIPGLGKHSPDVCLLDNVDDPRRKRTTVYVAREGARPVLVIEIVSVHDDDPEVRDNDVKIKVQEYYRAGVPLYVVVDQEAEDAPRRLRGFRRGKRHFVEFAPDAQGQLLLEPVGLKLGLRNDWLICHDAATGEEIPDFTGMAQARQQAEAALAAAQARIQELEAQASRTRRRPPRRRAP